LQTETLVNHQIDEWLNRMWKRAFSAEGGVL
jgi:hypothetical protein